MRDVRPKIFLLLTALFLCFRPDFGAQQNASAAKQNPTSTESPDPAANAAARKKRFEEERRRLEEGTARPFEGVPSSPNQTLFVSPAKVSMVAGNSHLFCVFDIDGRDLTASAEWSLSTLGVVDLVSEPEPQITAKNQGSVRLLAKVGGELAEAMITVFPGDTLPIGTIQWETPLIPGYRNQNFVQASGTTNGVDIYMMDKNANGDGIVRAIRADGRQVWMKKFPAGKAPAMMGPAIKAPSKVPSSSNPQL